MPRATALLCIALLGSLRVAHAYPPNFQDTQLVSGLTQPVALAWASDGRLFIAERTGAVKVWNGTSLSTAATLSVQSYGEQGLLGMALHPTFPTQPYLYLLYSPGSNPQTDGYMRLSRFTVSGSTFSTASELVLHSTMPIGYAARHVGGGLRASSAGHLYASDGENGIGPGYGIDALNRLEGKMIRINLDGSIPSTNPFVGTAGARPEIYHRGLRNPFKFALQPGTHQPFICDVGNYGWEEIDTGPAGQHFGWPDYEGTVSPQPAGIRNPLYAYSHSGGAAIVGCAFYTGGPFPPEYDGNFFFLDHVRGHLGRMVLDGSNNVVSVNLTWGQTPLTGPIDLAQGPDGSLYYSTFSPGTVRRVAYTGSTDVPDQGSTPVLSLAAAPNPFESATTLRFSLRETGPVRLHIFDVTGRRVRTLLDRVHLAGEHTTPWDGRDDLGRALPNGVFVVRLETGRELITTRVALAR